NQPGIAQWNLTRLAEAMVPLFDADQERAVERAREEVHRFADLFETYWMQGMRAKLGLLNEEPEDRALVDDLLDWMYRQSADFTNTFKDLSTVTDPAWRKRLQERRTRQTQSSQEVEALMRRSNPSFIPRNHKVEEALCEATGHNFSVMERLLDVLRSPYDCSGDLPDFSTPQDSRGYRTFCGT
ncbi:MAG: protein adenylyltransferase SelO family protein, partial [Vicinamibacterales bacterium]